MIINFGQDESFLYRNPPLPVIKYERLTCPLKLKQSDLPFNYHY